MLQHATNTLLDPRYAEANAQACVTSRAVMRAVKRIRLTPCVAPLLLAARPGARPPVAPRGRAGQTHPRRPSSRQMSPEEPPPPPLVVARSWPRHRTLSRPRVPSPPPPQPPSRRPALLQPPRARPARPAERRPDAALDEVIQRHQHQPRPPPLGCRRLERRAEGYAVTSGASAPRSAPP